MSSFLNELCNFYKRMTEAPDSGMPPDGMTSEQISFALVINSSGEFVNVDDLREDNGKKPERLFVPARVGRSGTKIAPNFLWDNTGYVLGVGKKGKTERTVQTFAEFKKLHEGMLKNCQGSHAKALLEFLRAWDPNQFDHWSEQHGLQKDSNVVFKLDGESRFLHEAPELKEVWAHALSGEDKEPGTAGICLVSGQAEVIARTHPKVMKVAGSDGTGASLVSFNKDSFESYGKKQSFNAPVSESASRAYTSALNYLLLREHEQTVQVGDTSLVFWAEQPNPVEKVVCRFLDLTPSEEKKAAQQDKEQIERIKGILLALRRGESLNEAAKDLDGGARFFVLGLASNAARISVRFWLTNTLEALLRNLACWYEDLAIERQLPDREPEFPPLWLLLARSLAALGKSENVPPELAGQLARCVLTGGHFPASVLAAILQRIHADKKVDYYRAALIKAALCRNYFTPEEGLSMQKLNENAQNIGYRLGRAFAILEKAQKDALGKDVNAPLRERYIGAASATPRLVFPLLLRLAQHHVTKARKNPKSEGYETIFSKRMGDILDEVNDFPAVLSLADQGRFMLGYYHQTNALYQKKEKANATEDVENAENNLNLEAAE